MTSARRVCECGCGHPLTGRQRKWATDACKSRGKRRRRDPGIGSFERKLRRREGLDKRYAGRVRFQAGRDLREWGPGGNLNPLICDDPAAAADSDYATYRRYPGADALYGFDGFDAHEVFIGFRDGAGMTRDAEGNLHPPAGWHSGPYWPRQKPRRNFAALATAAGIEPAQLRVVLRELVADRIEDLENVPSSLSAITSDEIDEIVNELQLPTVSKYEISGEPRFWIKPDGPMREFVRMCQEKFGAMPRDDADYAFRAADGYDDRCRACGRQMHGLSGLHRRECKASAAVRLWRTFDTWVAPPATTLPPMKWAHSRAWFEAAYLGRAASGPYTVTYPDERGRNIHMGREEVVSLAEYRTLRAQLEIQGESLARIETILGQIAANLLIQTGSPQFVATSLEALLLSAQLDHAA